MGNSIFYSQDENAVATAKVTEISEHSPEVIQNLFSVIFYFRKFCKDTLFINI